MKISAYLKSMRLRTLPLSEAGVVLGMLIAISRGHVSFWTGLFLILTTAFLQILSNLSNELGDTLHGTDSAADRQGMHYSIMDGDMTVEEMKRLIAVICALCCLSGLLMIWFSFGTFFAIEPIALIVLGAAAIWAATRYTLGKHPYGYIGLGDFFVFLFFGLVSVCGGYYVCSHDLSNFLVLYPACGIGFFSVGVLNVNNIRDMKTDAATRTTMALKMGERGARIYHTYLIVFGWLQLVIFALYMDVSWKGWLFMLTIPLYVLHLAGVWKRKDRDLDPMLPLLVMSTFLTSLLLGFGLLCCTSCAQRDAEITKEFVFTGAPFASSHASTIVEYPKGQLTVAFFGGSWEGKDDVCIYLCRKSMKDTLWSAPEMVAGDSLSPCWNPVLYMNSRNEMMLFYKKGPKIPTWDGHLMTSSDGGYTWKDDHILDEGLYGAIKNKPVTLSSGRIISGASEEFFPDENGFRKWTVHFELSDDGGVSWRKVGPVEMDDTLRVIQPTILQRKDGSLLALCRSTNGWIAATESRDNGETWSRMRLTDFPNNNSGIDAVTLPDGRFVLVCNPVSSHKGVRYPLCVYISDDAEHWTEIANLDSEPCKAGYAYPAVIYGSDGALHITYTWDRQLIRYARVPVPARLDQ